MLVLMWLLRRHRSILLRDIAILKRNKEIFVRHHHPECLEPEHLEATWSYKHSRPMVVQLNGQAMTGHLQLTMCNVQKVVMIPGKLLNIITT
jgi:hypothetical protein